MQKKQVFGISNLPEINSCAANTEGREASAEEPERRPRIWGELEVTRRRAQRKSLMSMVLGIVRHLSTDSAHAFEK